MIRAVTFDLWNTLILEGPGGLLGPRAEQWDRILRSAGFSLPRDLLEAAHADALAAYVAAWERGEQFKSIEATSVALAALGITVNATQSKRLARSFHDAGLHSDIDLAPGALDVLDAIRAAGTQTAIICDIGLTPSSALRPLLRRAGILDRIVVEAWSDQIGAYKPDPAIFTWVLQRLDVPASSALHVGDRLRTDVAGARDAGMRTVRYAGVFDDPAALPEADYVVFDLSAVMQVIEGSAD